MAVVGCHRRGGEPVGRSPAEPRRSRSARCATNEYAASANAGNAEFYRVRDAVVGDNLDRSRASAGATCGSPFRPRERLSGWGCADSDSQVVTDGRNSSVRRMVRMPGRDARAHARRCAARDLSAGPLRDAGLTVVGERFHQFEPQGVTGTVLLAESHLAIHTWPECAGSRRSTSTSAISTDNTAKARTALPRPAGCAQAERTRFQVIQRGGADALPERGPPLAARRRSRAR